MHACTAHLLVHGRCTAVAVAKQVSSQTRQPRNGLCNHLKRNEPARRRRFSAFSPLASNADGVVVGGALLTVFVGDVDHVQSRWPPVSDRKEVRAARLCEIM